MADPDATGAPDDAPPSVEASDVFISYSRRDAAFARRLVGELDARDCRCWVDWRDIPPSAEWMDEIKAAIDATDGFVFVLSDDQFTPFLHFDFISTSRGSARRNVIRAYDIAQPRQLEFPLPDAEPSRFKVMPRIDAALADPRCRLALPGGSVTPLNRRLIGATSPPVVPRTTPTTPRVSSSSTPSALASLIKSRINKLAIQPGDIRSARTPSACLEP